MIKNQPSKCIFCYSEAITSNGNKWFCENCNAEGENTTDSPMKGEHHAITPITTRSPFTLHSLHGNDTKMGKQATSQNKNNGLTRLVAKQLPTQGGI